MPEFFLELFSEEIPARMQAGAAADLARLLGDALAALGPADVRTWYGPRRIAYAAVVADSVPGRTQSERGPRANAPEAALAGFLRKFSAARDELRVDGDFYVLERAVVARAAGAVIAGALPGLLWKFPWPKSMRWGVSAFTWVRPLRRIVALLDGAVVPFALAQGEDVAHGLASGRETEGHRFHAPGAFAVEGAADWAARLGERRVLVAADERAAVVRDGLERLAAAEGCSVAADDGLLAEVSGLCEWPVPLLGPIDAAYMDLPAEVMQVSMRVNQRYFALRDAEGRAAPWFGFAANIEAADGGAAIVAGNARVLRARFSDARHFWDLDRRTRLEDRVEALRGVTFHAKLGSQYDRARRVEAIARALAPYTGADPATAARAGLLCKADLTTGMVGEFPELQGVMGGYYARHDGEAGAIAGAIADQYRAAGPAERDDVAIAVALADRIDTLCQFFAVGEKPTGSGDPFALRRAALGIITLIRRFSIRITIPDLVASAWERPSAIRLARPLTESDEEVVAFILERLRVQLRTEGAAHDVLAAILATDAPPEIVSLIARTEAVAAFIGSDDGANLLAGYKRAANILRIEDKKDGPHQGEPDLRSLRVQEEVTLTHTLRSVSQATVYHMQAERFGPAMAEVSALRVPVDRFFDRVTVNADEPALRLNRLRILATVKAAMDQIADFSQIAQ